MQTSDAYVFAQSSHIDIFPVMLYSCFREVTLLIAIKSILVIFAVWNNRGLLKPCVESFHVSYTRIHTAPRAKHNYWSSL